MKPVEYQTKPKVTMDQQLEELRKYMNKVNIYYFLNKMDIDRKKKLLNEILGSFYFIGIVVLIYYLINKNYTKCWYVGLIELVLTIIIAIIIKYIDRDYFCDFNTSSTNYAAYLFDRDKYDIEGTEYMAQSQYDYFVADAVKHVFDNITCNKDFFNSLNNKL